MERTGRLQDKVCVVTGSSSGLGRAISVAYFREGAVLVCADLQPQARKEVPEEAKVTTHELINESGGTAIFVKTNVADAEEVENLIKAAVDRYGRVDVIVNNAGVSIESGRPPARIHEVAESVWDTTMAVNTKSVYLCCKYAIAQMLKQEPHPSGDRGWIINMSSIFGLVGGRYNACYAASKGAVSNMTRNIALDYAEYRIHCNAICPGYTNTAIFVSTTQNFQAHETVSALHPFGGIGRISDITGPAIFLASDEAGWITGVSLPVDGGYTAQ